MKTTAVGSLAWVVLLLPSSASQAGDLSSSTAFTYQGRLEQNGVPVNQDYCFVARLFESIAGGDPIGPTLNVEHVDVVNGFFTLELDFGQQFATDGDRYLDLQVMDDDDSLDTSGLVQLAPRQRITATPLALHALRANIAEQAESAGLAEHAGLADLANAAHRLDAPDGLPTSAVFVDNNGKIGVGTTAPAARLDVKGEGDTSPTAGAPIARFTRGNGNNFLAIFADIGGNYIIADDPTNNQKDLRLQTRNNRNILLEPHGTGGVGIGTAPATLLHARGAGPAMVLQDTASASNQAGYVAFWNNAGTETAWAGFGTAGSPDFSVVNARSGGDIVLWPFSGDVVVNATLDIGIENLNLLVQDTGTASLNCPAGKRALSGGCACVGAILVSQPNGSGWFCDCRDENFVQVFVRCARVK